MLAAVSAPRRPPQSLAEVVAVVVAAAAAVVEEAAWSERGAPQASAGRSFATNSSVAAVVDGETPAAMLTCRLRTQVVVVALRRPRPPPRELDLPQPLGARRASAGEWPKSTALPHWSVAIPCGISSSTLAGGAEGCYPRKWWARQRRLPQDWINLLSCSTRSLARCTS